VIVIGGSNGLIVGHPLGPLRPAQATVPGKIQQAGARERGNELQFVRLYYRIWPYYRRERLARASTSPSVLVETGFSRFAV
jgi:hypothetical protein